MVTIRDIRAEDRAGWEPMWEGYNTFYERTVPTEATDHTWGLLLDPDTEPFGFVAETDGTLIGFTHFWFQGTTAAILPKCYLQDLFVDPASRGKRVGALLIEAVYEAADKHGNSEVYWLTQHFNERGRALYDRIGKLTPFIKYHRP